MKGQGTAVAETMEQRDVNASVIEDSTAGTVGAYAPGNCHIHVVLHEPEIPQNTGNIARTCAATGASLHLIEPLGFTIDDKKMKRAGLDYWDKLDVHFYKDVNAFFEAVSSVYRDAPVYMFTTKAQKKYTDVVYPREVFLMFGKETKGLPEELLVAHEKDCVRIPMRPNLRSLNLSNSVAIAVYEVLRQQDFPDLETVGKLHTLKWGEGQF